MARQGFKRDPKAIRQILFNDPGGKAAVRAAAQQILDRMPSGSGTLEEYESKDRFVVAVKVPADSQAKHGTATRAANG